MNKAEHNYGLHARFPKNCPDCASSTGLKMIGKGLRERIYCFDCGSESFDGKVFEAREKKIGSITIVKNPNFPSGTSLQAYIKTNRAELRKVFGNPNMGESGDGKSKGKEWNLIVGNHRVTIYDKREKDKKGTKYFNIGGSRKYAALLVAQALSIHRNERVYAKEIVPQWLEDKRHYQQVKSIDEHPDLTYERAKEYEDNRGRYGAEYDIQDMGITTIVADNEDEVWNKFTGDKVYSHDSMWEIVDVRDAEYEKTDDERILAIQNGKGKRVGTVSIEDVSNDKDKVFISIDGYNEEDEHGSHPMIWDGVIPDSIYMAETFDVEFNEWAEQEMMSHGKDISFKDWAEDEGMKHGDVPITEWAQHEDESHDARYGAETSEDDYVDYTMWIYTKSTGGLFSGEWEDGESEEQVVKEWKELVREAIEQNGDDLITADLRKHSNYDEDGVAQSSEFLFQYEHGEDNLDDFESENWGGNPKGQLATALRNARIKAKQPKKPLKIEKLDAENERPQEMSYFFVYVPSETGKYGREGEKYDVHYFRTLEEAQKAFGDSYEIYEYRALEDVPPEEREKQKQDNQEWYDRSKKGEFFEDFWWKNEMSRYGNSDAGRLHHSTYDSSVENDERDGFYEKTILPSEPSRREQETNRYLADDLGISETLAELLNASRTFGMYISQRAHPDTVKKYRQRILDGFDAYGPESKKEQKIVKMVRQNMATRGVKGPSPSYVGTNRGILRKPELHYVYDDYYDNPIPFMGYELTDEEKKIIGKVKDAETSGQWEIGEQLEEAQMDAEGKKRSGLLSDPFDELSLDSGDWKGIVAGFGVGLLALFGYSKLRK